ncbi:MAG: hypothetical protein HYY87_02295 [Candidatus Levybacteria bacterium]|nr:hypothetical protein [Candidatus Levybacteria bacterium]MBI2190133.1 hypothetical protein [Candidatus Levybacteria bacterium]MBI3070111.1 hypothetical protein [Candidatus Levybacteria bacterium]
MNILIKIAVLLLLALYIAFTFVIFVQVRTMNKVVSQPTSSKTLIVLALLQVILSFSLFLIALDIL